MTSLDQRLVRYQAIENKRQRPLIVYATSTRQNVGAQIAGDVVRELIDQMDPIKGGDRVDVLIHSTGGDALAAWKLMSVLRERFSSVGVLVPSMAFSAATLFALGADEIVMHPHASLGPIDPQVTIVLPDGNRRQFSYEDVGAFLRFIGEEVRVTEQLHVSAIVDRLFAAVDPLHVGAAKRASELSTSVGERLLLLHMNTPEDRPRARTIAENLNKSFFAHGDAVSKSRAKSLGLKVAPDDPELEALIWSAYLGLETYMELREPFHPLGLVLQDPAASAALAPAAPLVLPPNAPQQLVDQLWTAAAQQALNGAVQGQGVEVPYSVVNAVMESLRCASEYRTDGRVSAVRLMGGDVRIAGIETPGKWRKVAVPEPPPVLVGTVPAQV